MGTDPRPWMCWQNLPWQSVNLNHDGNANMQNLVPPIAGPDVLPSYANRFGFGAGGDAPPAVAASSSLQRSSAFTPPLDPVNAPTEVPAERRFLIFDHSSDGTSLLFSSIAPLIWNPDYGSPKPKPFNEFGMRVEDIPENYAPVNISDGTDVSNGGGFDETHEDTEEIDALLYSDSEFESANAEENEAEGMPASAEEVASNSIPTKRRKLNEEEAIDLSLMDTASSVMVQKLPVQYEENMDGSKGDESSCVGAPVGGVTEEQEVARDRVSKSLKRVRIEETLCMLRKIIPGGKGKDDTAVLDEAIRYLRSLKVKAKGLGNSQRK
uniref:Transcription factor SAC51 n=1 Tax=Anthurium amnicola TaxID=1678845 RepID=A0A1D1ZAV5_9ARAE